MISGLIMDQIEDAQRASMFERAQRFAQQMSDSEALISRAQSGNTTGIQPTEFKVLIKPDPVEEKTKGGIIIPDQTKEREEYATVKGQIIAVSPLAFSYARDEEWDAAGAQKPKAGDRVIYAKFAGVRVKGKDGQEYLLINDKDLVATIEE